MKKSKKVIIGLMTAAMCFGSSVAAFGSAFSDINNVPWQGAATYIDKAYEYGLIAGYNENGKLLCKAKNNVTYCESIQFVYNLLSKTGNLKSTSSYVSKWSAILKGYNIPDWAQLSVSYALENSILSISDLSKFMNGTTQNNATREDVAVFLGKALSSNYTVNSNPSLSYADTSSITTTARPYVELLNRLKIMVGDSANKFNPKSKINRAELCVILAQTYDVTKSQAVETARTIKGTVSNIVTYGNDLIISVKTTSGTESLYVKYGYTNMYKSDKSVAISTLKTNDEITAICFGTNVSSLTITSSVSTASETKGEITSLSSSKITIKNADGNSFTYTLLSDTDTITVKIDGITEDFDELKDLYDDDEKIEATLTLNSSSKVSKIVAVTAENELKGVITSLTTSKIKIKSGSTTYTYNLVDDTDDITVKIDGTTEDFDELLDLYEDDEELTVTLELNSKDEVKKITATTKEETISGDLTYLSTTQLSIKKSGKESTYKLISDRDDITVKINGTKEDYQALRDLYNDGADIEVEIVLNSSDKVTKITATTDDIGDVTGTVYSLSYSKITIKSGSSRNSYYLISDTDEIKVKIDGKTRDFDYFYDLYGDGKDMKVTLTLNSSDKVKEITVKTGSSSSSDELKGRLRKLSTGYITIRVDRKDYEYRLLSDHEDVSIVIDNKTENWDELMYLYEEDYIMDVELTLNTSDRVKKIDVTTYRI